MKKNIFAVCDLEVDYACNFMDFLTKKNNIPFEIQAFTNITALKAFAEKNHIELLLISARAMCDEVSEIEVGKLVILSEENSLPKYKKYPSVYKYQSSSDVIREVMSCYGETKTDIQPSLPIHKKTEFIGIYSPVGRCMKTSFALTLGQLLAKEKNTLYLNLEEYSGIEVLMKKEFTNSISDLMYYAHQKHHSLIHKMNGMIQSIQGMDYIPPVKTPSDIRNVGWEDWEFLFHELLLHSSYEVVLLDMGSGETDLVQLLQHCNKIYMPILPDLLSACKIAQFKKMLKLWDMSSITEKIIEVRPPLYEEKNPERYIEQLPWSELGDYVREILRKESQMK